MNDEQLRADMQALQDKLNRQAAQTLALQQQLRALQEQIANAAARQ